METAAATSAFEVRVRRLGREKTYDAGAFRRLEEELYEAQSKVVEDDMEKIGEFHLGSRAPTERKARRMFLLSMVADVYMAEDPRVAGLTGAEFRAIDRALVEYMERPDVVFVADPERKWKVSVSRKTIVETICMLYRTIC
jgi:hypothetical protein